MDPFTSEEEMGLVTKLDTLSVASLESYIASAKTSLANNALASTWRPRIEFGVRHAEQALIKAQAAAARNEAAPVVAAPKAKKAAAVVVADDSSEDLADE